MKVCLKCKGYLVVIRQRSFSVLFLREEIGRLLARAVTDHQIAFFILNFTFIYYHFFLQMFILEATRRAKALVQKDHKPHNSAKARPLHCEQTTCDQ